jgi:hypothetical protein
MKKQTDKNTEYMSKTHGTTCLVSERAGQTALEIHRSSEELKMIDS